MTATAEVSRFDPERAASPSEDFIAYHQHVLEWESIRPLYQFKRTRRTPVASLGEYSALALHLRDSLGLATLVETGTYEGASTYWASKNFARVMTIEISQKFHTVAAENCRGCENVEFYFGDSRQVLPKLLSAIDAPVLLWLDAHNAAKLFSPGRDDCPLLDELTAIGQTSQRHAILIDDAHTFATPAMYQNWPTMDEIVTWAFANCYTHTTHRDVLVLVHNADADVLHHLPAT